MGRYARGEFLEALMSNVPLSAVVTHFRSMKICGHGKRLVGISPFSKEKTPSFLIYDAEDRYHDFSTGRDGDIITYLTAAHQMSPHEAVAFIQEQSGYIFIPKKFQRKRPKRRRTHTRGM